MSAASRGALPTDHSAPAALELDRNFPGRAW